jgi:hypothetical protein
MKATVTDSYMNTQTWSCLEVGDYITAVGARCCDEQTKYYLKQLCSEWLLTEDHGLTPAGRIKKPSVILCQWIVTTWLWMSPEVIKKALNSAVYPVQWMGLMICCGMSVKRMGMLALSVRKVKVQTVRMERLTLIGKGQ